MEKILEIIIQDTVPGRLPRIPKEEWESKRRPEEKITCSISEWTPEGIIEKEPVAITMPGGLYLEDILIWCECDEQAPGDYVEEEDGTHGALCANCGGVIHLG